MAHRYLIQFDPKHTPHVFADVLIVGAGIAGLRAALEIPAALDVLVVTKDNVQQSSSTFAQGGIAGVLSPEDRFENHIEDTIAAGGGLCDRAIVELVVREAPAQINDLIGWGTQFDLEEGQLALTREAGHSHRRIVHALGDAAGHEGRRAIIEQARRRPNIRIWDGPFTIDLLTDDGGGAADRMNAVTTNVGSDPIHRVRGAVVSRPGFGTLMVWAKQTI